MVYFRLPLLSLFLLACSAHSVGPAQSFVYRDRTAPLEPLAQRARTIEHQDLHSLRVTDKVRVDRLGRIATHGDPGTPEQDVMLRMEQAAAAWGATHVVIENREMASAADEEVCGGATVASTIEAAAIARESGAGYNTPCQMDGDVIRLHAALYRIENQAAVPVHLRAK